MTAHALTKMGSTATCTIEPRWQRCPSWGACSTWWPWRSLGQGAASGNAQSMVLCETWKIPSSFAQIGSVFTPLLALVYTPTIHNGGSMLLSRKDSFTKSQLYPHSDRWCRHRTTERSPTWYYHSDSTGHLCLIGSLSSLLQRHWGTTFRSFWAQRQCCLR